MGCKGRDSWLTPSWGLELRVPEFQACHFVFSAAYFQHCQPSLSLDTGSKFYTEQLVEDSGQHRVFSGWSLLVRCSPSSGLCPSSGLWWGPISFYGHVGIEPKYSRPDQRDKTSEGMGRKKAGTPHRTAPRRPSLKHLVSPRQENLRDSDHSSCYWEL